MSATQTDRQDVYRRKMKRNGYVQWNVWMPVTLRDRARRVREKLGFGSDGEFLEWVLKTWLRNSKP